MTRDDNDPPRIHEQEHHLRTQAIAALIVIAGIVTALWLATRIITP